MEDIKAKIEPVFSLFRGNKACFDEILNQSRDQMDLDTGYDSSDDCILIGNSVPLPLDSTKDELTKQEGDPISNNIPFNNSVSVIAF